MPLVMIELLTTGDKDDGLVCRHVCSGVIAVSGQYVRSILMVRGALLR
jgi:hypothetical protein